MASKTTECPVDIRKPDSQGRIVIGKEHADESYSVEKQKNGDILLRPVMVIHKQEAWLLSNLEALASVKRGLEDMTAGRVQDLGSFAQYANDDDGDEE